MEWISTTKMLPEESIPCAVRCESYLQQSLYYRAGELWFCYAGHTQVRLSAFTHWAPVPTVGIGINIA
jgi:hypothetical protein